MLAVSTGLTIGSIVFVVISITPAFWPAWVAGRKRHSFIGYLLLSLLFFPLAISPAYAVEDRTKRTTV